MSIRVLLANNHPVGNGAADVLQSEHQPDVTLMSLHMPAMGDG